MIGRTLKDASFRIRVKLWVKLNMFEQFRDYENQALAIMKDHGLLKFEIVSAPTIADEVHDIEFSSQEAFDCYRADPRLTALSNMREACIERAEIEFQ